MASQSTGKCSIRIRAWLQPCRHNSHFDSGPAGRQSHPNHEAPHSPEKRTNKGCPTSRAFRDVGANHSTTTDYPTTVILSAVASSRSEEATQSKDPYAA